MTNLEEQLLDPQSSILSRMQVYISRDTTFDGLTIGTQNYGYHYSTDVITPQVLKRTITKWMCSLMNDASIIRNITPKDKVVVQKY